MASFNKTIITNKGKSLIAKSLINTDIKFTKICTSDKEYSLSVNLEALESLSNIKQTQLVSEIKIINNSTVQVISPFTNEELTAGYYLRAIALYATDPDEGEILYSITTSIMPDWIPPYASISITSFEIKLATVISNSNDVDLNVSPTAVVNIGQFNEFKESVRSSLSEIPNQTYITEKAKTVDVNNALALKANQSDLDTTNTDVANNSSRLTVQENKKISQADITPELLAQIAGTTAINAITSDYSIVNRQFKNPMVVGIKSKNLFDKTDITFGQYVAWNTGVLNANASYSASNFIPIQPSTVYSVSGTIEQYAWFDANKNYISGSANAGANITSPSNAYFIRQTMLNTQVNNVQIETGSVATSYESFNPKIDSTLLKSSSVTNSILAQESVTPDKISTSIIAADNIKTISNLPSTDVKSNIGTLYTTSTLVGSMAINLNKAGDSTSFNIVVIPFKNDSNVNIKYAYCIIRNYSKTIIEKHFKPYIGGGDYVFELNQTHIPGENMYIQVGVCDINLNNIQSTALPLSISSEDILITRPVWYQADGSGITSSLIQANSTWYGFNYRLKYIANTSKIYKIDDVQYAKKTDLTPYDALLSNGSKFQFLMPSNIYLNDNVQLWAYWNNIIHMWDVFRNLPTCPQANSVDATGYSYNNDKLIINGKSQAMDLQILDYSHIASVWNTAPATIADQNITINSKTHATGKNINTLIIGDSYIAVQWGEGTLQYIKDFAITDGNSINFKGSKSNYGDGTLLSESTGGWNESQFHTSSSSPFVFNGSFDFAQYLSTNNITNVDNIVFFLGMNGGNGDDINAMITNIKSVLPSVKIFVCMVPSAALNPMVTSNWYSQVMQTQRIRNIQNLYYLQKFDNRQAENIYLVPTHAVMDRVAGIRSATYDKYQFSDCDSTKENLANDHHPTPLGAKALAYIIYNYLSYFTA